MVDKLEACPFCGGEAELIGFRAPEVWVHCSAMGCKAQTEAFGSKERAIAAWNRRVPEVLERVERNTVAFVQDWLMSGDHEPTQWDRDFAAAIDARASGFTDEQLTAMAGRFCATPLPESVCADLVAIKPMPGRSGTNLLTVSEAKQMLAAVLSATPSQRLDAATVERCAQVKVNEDYRAFLSGVEGVVEADSYAMHMLWREYAEDARKFMPGDTSNRYSWEQGRSGYGVNVGKIGGRPVWISILCNVVNGQKLLFWHVTSPVAHYDLCEEWLKAHLPPTAFRDNGYINRTEPTNFSNILRRALATEPHQHGGKGA